MINFENVTKIFNTELFTKPFVAVNDLSFNVTSGKIVGFLGANGAGKTTSLKMLMGFIKSSAGTIDFSHEMGSTKKEIFQNIGFLPERPYFYPHLSGRELCYFMGELTNLKKNEIEKSINYWAPKFKIDFALDRKVRKYSKGMLQRIGFLVTLLHDPKLIILDEPLSGLDPIGRKELKDIIRSVNADGKTVFFSSHILSDVEEVCDEVIFIKEGKLIYQGSVEEIIRSNSKDLSEVVYLDNNGSKKVLMLDSDSLKSEVEGILNKDFELVSIKKIRPSLEEIFYKV
ncbi:MAG: ABC transporter ATP-binding protein [Bacteriovoracaceae bacterium]|jgi:ABC-2 type transport system ATP-binding protein|nr:ABC transporter ATP-binding protein [Bacteriovoracaceae bacterium]